MLLIIRKVVKKILILSVFISLFSSLSISVLAEPVAFDRILGKTNPDSSVTDLLTNRAIFPRGLKQPIKSVEIYMGGSFKDYQKRKIKINNRSYLWVIEDLKFNSPKAIYFVKDDVIKGYCLIEDFLVYDRFSNDPELQQIYAVSESTTYFSNKLKMFSNVNVLVRSQFNEQSEETYVFVSVLGLNFLFIDAYFPMEIKAMVYPLMVDALNSAIVRFHAGAK
ncbi:hypothetical protein COW36_06070 [bacterium (Candidatus Blackallbacteria) CG17_big_fil_post_rev_8_21_14_2_50_48_46]|uniref:Uncharacterized protein n=1 Tax=bacterium (Candidatus Blackallbacteria) CG17_big_fil_post_rev_8_21_14_2_50_48_46 TaxID=2014261 RepID=A0A2M7G7W7_9BACT|nr:MAG: hypothetical protein COW64_16900 [bacterium (Candidatus Blackallbacteria) CG18_big_fil_WC_8_21_14_2_50_49_26]PIW18093.1 MAG: hypothetical protein COW36_06070 [bacterium (Candidatus Blackallbacteria) CG17_big_fil_post_rev_8_21_14_2_50_48_46]PIW51102.1 MAG: hypothetical protein COW20_00220 [bacterium (Candidatus Blackallbacteria) CG13_big_fil_rev_8_21_14_2_50_49_14]